MITTTALGFFFCTLVFTHWVSYSLGAIRALNREEKQLEKIEEVRREASRILETAKRVESYKKESIKSIVKQLDEYADYIEMNYMDSEESSVIRSCSNMLRKEIDDL
jgi:hypothetical protein